VKGLCLVVFGYWFVDTSMQQDCEALYPSTLFLYGPRSKNHPPQQPTGEIIPPIPSNPKKQETERRRKPLSQLLVVRRQSKVEMTLEIG
jgi:hypothetical protein